MASAQEYADWLRNNQDKRDTSDYRTVLAAFQRSRLAELATPAEPAKPAAAGPQSGGYAALKAGIEGLRGAKSALSGKLGFTDMATAKAEIAASKKREAEIFKPTEESWTEAPGTKFAELLGGSAPYMALPAAAALGAAALPLTGVAATAAGLGAAGLVSLGQHTGTGLVRQMEGEEGSVPKKSLEETSLPAALAAGAGSAILDTVSMRMIPGIGRMLGQAGVKVTAETAKEIAEQGLKKTLTDYTLKTGKAAGVEGVTEAAQQFLERMQAGLSLTSEKARDEYFESLLGGAILGGTLAPAGRFIERGGEQREARGLLEKKAQEESKAAAAAAEAEKKTPAYALRLDTDYQAAVAKMRELQAAVPKKPAKDALPEEQMAYKAAVDARNAHLKEVLNPLTAEYAPRKAEIAQLKERQRIEGLTPLEYQMEQAGVTFPAEEQRVFTGEEDLARAPAAPTPEAQYAQAQMALAQRQDLGTFEAKDFVEYLMQDPAMAQQLVKTQTPIPGLDKKTSNAVLSGLKLQLAEQKSAEQKQLDAQLQQQQKDLLAQKQPAEKDPLALWKESLEQADTQASEELERINFETIRPSGPPTVEVAPGITPIQNPDTLVKRLDALIAERDAAEVAADVAYTSGNREAGVKKSQEREAAQAALNNLEQAEGAPRALMLLRKAQEAALMNATQLIDDLKAGRTLGGPEAGTASSTPQTLINEVNRQRDALITATIQEAAATRRLYGKSLTQEEADTAAKQIREVFNEWVTRSMAQPLTDVNWVDKLLATMEAERAVAGKNLAREPWVQPLKQKYIEAQLTDALVKRLGRQRMEEISKGTAELKGAETTLPPDTVRAVTSKAEADFSRLLQDAQKKAIAQASDPRPLEERRFGAYRAATQVLQEQIQEVAANLRQIPRTFTREQPLLKTQFAASEAAKVAEASGETAETAEGALRRRRAYVDGLISQAFAARRVPGIAEVLLNRTQDFLQKPLESTTATGEKRVQYRGTNALLDAAENIAGRILRGQTLERSDLVALRDELRSESARPGEAEVAGEREGQRELFPAAERRALAPKTTGVNLVGEPSQAGSIGFIREKPAAFEAARAKEAAKYQRVLAVSERSEQLTDDIRAALDRLDVAQREASEKKVKERSDSLQSAWQSAVKKAKQAVVQARLAAQKPQVAALKKEINDIRKGGIEGLNKETVDRMLAALAALDALDADFDAVVEAAEFVPIAMANKWVAFEREALAEAKAARDKLPTPVSEADVKQKQAALARAEQAQARTARGDAERAVAQVQARAAQGQVRSAEGTLLPGIRVQRQALTAEIAALEERLPKIKSKAKKAAALRRLEALKTRRAGAPERIVQGKEPAEVAAEKRAEDSAAYAARQAAIEEERAPLEQQVLDLGTQIAELEAAQKRARTPAGKAKIQEKIDARNKELTIARGQLEALDDVKPRRKGPATTASSAGLARQKPLRTGYRKTLAEASEGLRRERERDVELPGIFEFGPQDKLFSRGATENPSTTADVRAELGKVFPDLGRVQIFDSVEALVAANPEYEGRIPDDARGFVDPDTNKAFLIAENIEQGQALGVLLHEVGAHIGLKNMLGDAQYNALVKVVNAWAKKNDGSIESRVAKAAQERVEAAQTPANQKDDELLAYAIEEAVNAGVKPMETKGALGQWLSQIAQLFRKALEKFGLPAKALDAQGLVDMAFGAAKMEMTGTPTPPRPKKRSDDVMFTYAGERSGIAAKELREAKELTSRGVPMEEVWGKTGWFQGADKKWRFEIDDSQAKFNYDDYYEALKDNSVDDKGRVELKLSNILWHPKLYKTYPGLKDLSVKLYEEPDSNLLGSFSKNGIELNLGYTGTDTNTESVLLHEIQHYIQEQEGFTRGSNTTAEYMRAYDRKVLGSVRETYARMAENGSESEKQYYSLRVDALDAGIAAANKARIERAQELVAATKAYRAVKAEVRAAIEKIKTEYTSIKQAYDAIAALNDKQRAAHKKFLAVKYSGKDSVDAAVTAAIKAVLPKDALFGEFAKTFIAEEAYLNKYGEVEARDVEQRRTMSPQERAATRPYASQPQRREEILFSRNVPTAARVANALVGKEKGWVDYLRDNFLGMGFRAQFVDKLAPIEEALKKGGVSTIKALQAMYFLRMYDQRMHITSEAMTEGVSEVVEKTRKDGGTERIIQTKPGANIKKVVDILKQKDVIKAAGSADAANKLFTLYLAAIRAERVGAQTLNFGGKVTDADLKAARAEIEADPVLKKAFGEARDIYNQYNRNLLEFSVQTGALSRDVANKLLADNDYIPYYRIRDGVAQMVIGNETPIRIGNLKDSPHLKELVKGDEAIFDFLTSSVQNTAMLLDMAMKNLATKNAMFELRDVGLATISKVPKSGKTPEGAVTFKRDGEDYFAIVDTDTIGIDSDLLVKGMAGIPTMFPSIVRLLGIPARLLRRTVVASPVYMARQLFRDSLAASMTSGANITPVLGALRQIGKADVLRGRGITGGQVFTGMPEDVTRMLKEMQAGRVGVSSGLAWLEAKSAQMDSLTRRAQYQSYLDQGLSEMEATFMALESMNFSKRGLSPTMHMVSTVIPFFNAQIQGLDVLYKAFTGQMPMNERLDIRRKLVVRGALMFGMSLAYAAAMQDDKAYKNAKPEEKYGNWFVPMEQFGIKEPLRLPIPFELGYVFKSLPEALVNSFSNEKGGEEAMKAAKYFAGQMVPGLSNYFIPQAFKPGLEAILNKSIYTERDIESTKEQMVEPGARYRDNTTAAAREIGELLNISPVKMEYLIRGYTGSMGMALLAAVSAPFGNPEGPQAATKRITDIPLFGMMFQPTDASGIIDATYDRMKEVRMVKETYDDMIEKGRVADAQKYLSTRMNEMALVSVEGSFREYMGQIAEYERGIKASNMTPDEKREKIDAAKQMKIRLATAVRAVADKKEPQAAPA